MDTIIVKQERGQDSTVQVFEETRKSWPIDERILRFVSDQSLTSNSDRAWNVEKAIKEYAHPRGYDCQKPEKNEIIAVYNPRTHSAYLEWQIREQVQYDPRFEAKADEAKSHRDEINQEYGIAIRQLKNLVKALEDKNEAKLKAIRQELIDCQKEIVSGIELPEELTKLDRERLTEPNWPLVKIETDSYNDYGQRGVLPTNLTAIMALLD